jgi:hypothetical protein
MWWGRSSAEEANDLITDGGGEYDEVLPGIVIRAGAVGPNRRRRSLPSGDGREREARHRPEIVGTGRRRHAIDRAAADALCLVERSTKPRAV